MRRHQDDQDRHTQEAADLIRSFFNQNTQGLCTDTHNQQIRQDHRTYPQEVPTPRNQRERVFYGPEKCSGNQERAMSHPSNRVPHNNNRPLPTDEQVLPDHYMGRDDSIMFVLGEAVEETRETTMVIMVETVEG
uniref:Uncharacterized protein n=1 Tax=Cannabis sativa TaxID=3483 RepID=A0A803Q5C8_CANSA